MQPQKFHFYTWVIRYFHFSKPVFPLVWFHKFFDTGQFGVKTNSVHFWEIQNWRFCLSNSSLTRYKNSFWKILLYLVRDELKGKNLQFWISQKGIRGINIKFLPVINLYEIPLCAKNQGHKCSKFGFPAKNVKNF